MCVSFQLSKKKAREKMIYNRKLKLQQLAFLQISLFLREHMLLSSSLKPFEISL